MKKALLVFVLILGFIANAQSKKDYFRFGKLTTAEINAIDTTRTDVIYEAYNDDLGIKVINRRDNNGWVPLITAGAGTGDFLANGTVPMTGNLNLDGNNIISGGTINADWLTATNTVSAGQFTGGYARLNRASDPGNDEGNIYVNSVSKLLRYYNGTSWVDVPGGSGSGSTNGNPDLYPVQRTANGNVTNDWGVTTGQEAKRNINWIWGNGTNYYYNIPSTFTSLKRIQVETYGNNGAMIFTSDHYQLIGNGVENIQVDANETDGVIGFYVDSLNTIAFHRTSDALAGTIKVDGYFKPYSISQVTGLESSNITETSFTLTWNAATASVGTISNYQYSIDGAAPVTVTGATTVNITGLTAGTTYNLNVRAVDAGGNPGQYSADLSVTTASSVVNVYNGQNAADPNTEGNNVLTIEAGGSITLTSSTEQASNGTYSVKGVSTGGTATYPNLQNITSGDTVEVSIDVYINSGFTGNVSLNLDTGEGWTANQSTSTTTTGSWVTLTLTGVASSNNPKLRIGVGTGTHYTDNYRTVIQ